MHLIIDCTTTQNQLKHHGIGVYTKNVVKNIIRYPETKFSLLLFNAPSTLDETLKNRKENVEIIRIGKLRKSDYLNTLWFNTQYLPNIKKIKTEDSIYYCPYFWAGIPSITLPTVLMIHDMILPIFNIYSEGNKLKNFIKKQLYWIELNKSKKCKGIVVNSQCTKDDYLKYYPDYDPNKIKVVYLDAELEGTSPNWDEKLPHDYKQKGYYIYMGGTVYKNKNSKGVVDGYSNLLQKLPSKEKAPYLIIAGGNFVKDNQQATEFREYIKDKGLENKIILTGFYEDNQSQQLLSNSIAMLHLSLYEGFGISLVEGMKAGTAVIAHNGSCYPEVLNGAGILVDGKNEEEVGEAMLNVYQNREYRDEIVRKGLERAQQFSWEKTAAETYQFIKSFVTQ
ncbi:MAG: Glycosyl transferase group 1 [candidate division WS6 bacterium 34_10]|uniref:Glycosyl transferase group 1 n=1 Tax=candidate division WS6 bacterium 34_10 TaxID=1641389 RepID=A0A124FXC4_9BACT|nr:MAG: Glycosyl transferase group 1 [candidate division WS6 bacterium 34_10]